MKKYITKQSSIKGAGKGLFTKESFKKGEVIGLAHVDDQPASEIGRNHNHNEKNPTAYSKKIDNKRYIYASKDLKPGEEITTNYRLQPELEQPEDFMRKGGSLLKMPNKKNSKGYSRSLSATNKLFTQNFLFAKPKSRKNKVFDPNANYAEGGEYEDAELTPEEIEEYRANGYIVDDTIYAEGGESSCPKGEYWNGTKCVKIPKNTRIVYHTDKDVYDKAFAAESDSSHFYNNAKSDFNKFDKLGDRFSTHMSDAEWQKTSDEYDKLLNSQKKKWHTDEYIGDIYTPNHTVNYKYKGPKSGLTIKPVGLEGFYREGYRFPRFKKPVIHNVYEEPIVEEKKIEEKIENLPLLKPSLIQQQNYQLQGNNINEEKLKLPNEEVESKYLEEGSPDTENPMEWVDKRKYNIDWNGIQIPYRLPRFRKPGHYGDLIKPGKKRYINLPKITSRNTAYLREEQDGGNTDAMTGMMKARLAYANEFGNPAAKRMINIPDNPYQFDNGDTGTHYMASMDNYAVPQIQDENGVLQLGDYGPESNEAIRFDSDEDANYFAENYKDVSPGFIEAELDEDEIEEYRRGGYIVEDISIPSLNQMQNGGENENLPNKVQDLNEVTVYGNQEKIKLQGSLIDRLKQVKKAYNDHRVNLGLEKQKQSAEGTSSIISLKDQIQSYKKELNEEKKSYDKASKALNVLKKYNPESYKKAKVSDVLNTTGVDDLRNLYKEGKISDATFMDFYDNFGKSYDREVTRTTEEDQVKLEDSWYGKPDEKGRTRWMGNPNNVSKVAQTVAIGAPLAAAAPIMAPAIGATLAVPEIAGGLNAYFAGHGINEFSDPNSLTRKSMSRAYDDPTASNIGDAAFDVGVNSLNFVGLPFGKAIKGANPKNIAKRILEIPSENMTARLSPEDLKIYRQVQDIARLRAKNVPYSKQLITAMEYNIPEEHLLNIFGKSKSEIEELIPFMKEQEAFRLANPASERINLVRPARSGTSRGAYGEYTSGERVATPTVLDDVVDVDAQENSLEIIANNLNDNVLSDILRSRPDRNSIVRNAVESNITSIAGVEEYISNYIINNPIRRGRTLIGQETPRQSLYGAFKEDVSDVANTFKFKANNLNKKVKKNLEKVISNYPVHEGVVLENVPTLNLRGSGSLKKVSDKVASNSTANIKSGDVFTGSLNTSHNSYLPQLKQVFKYKDGAPQFLGYKPMNSAGFLSEYHYSPEQINKYLNTEIDDLIKKGIVPNNIERPFLKNESIILPHYGIKQYKQGGTTNDYVDAELTSEEIKDLIAQGYVIEELN